jgi:hypothetical protein
VAGPEISEEYLRQLEQQYFALLEEYKVADEIGQRQLAPQISALEAQIAYVRDRLKEQVGGADGRAYELRAAELGQRRKEFDLNYQLDQLATNVAERRQTLAEAEAEWGRVLDQFSAEMDAQAAASRNFQAAAQYAVPEGVDVYPGTEPGGVINKVTSLLNLPVQGQQFNPNVAPQAALGRFQQQASQVSKPWLAGTGGQ